MKKIVFALLLCYSLTMLSQQQFEIKKLGFSIDVPKDWISYADDEMMSNIDKFDFSAKQMSEFIKSHNESVNFATFTKYNPRKYAGIIPTIKIVMRENPTTSSAEFLQYVHAMNRGARGQFENFSITQQPILVKISGVDAVRSNYTFSLSFKGVSHKIRCNTYYIPRKDYFLTLNFIEEIEKEDNSNLFDAVFESIKLANQ